MTNDAARVWIYQSDRVFNTEEIVSLNQILKDFTITWTAHNQQLKADFEIKYNRFIILIVDEQQAGASGCSIDKSVHLMQEIEKQFNVNLFDRFHIAWKENDDVKSGSRDEFEHQIKIGNINQETIVFNNLVSNYDQLYTTWEIPFKNSWHSKVFKLESVI
ncbi:ABC transporter ATPase [Pedobacter psychrophilus]|uniref:ABC transporter ATPase n=1 Tax=Pedobacter psychrophilus TaxID=1826909 RepID=A0A179DI56_9SPHI|nr:ABC transporter ATPase [Pedobacter psychrophilus]OAQ40574.1 ABC transporter ATPase [Pedobacter psychrophilus]